MSYLAAELAEIQEKFIIVAVDKASNSIVFVCKTHYINCLKEEAWYEYHDRKPYIRV